ncbi:hypothetical protein HAHE_37790 [Haloferula helveola]|uniref:Uncharacterized protein n=1 Tax=Haloferula helveola TaxID=490095 RepID=A0ABN6H884_9BACT|nr:hypothetical protein HAHE_37790 [Haloferula helveola]
MRSARRYAFGFVGIVAGFTLVAAAINTWVNPLRVTPAPWSDPSLEQYREISNQIRTGKAGILRSSGHADAAFVGSSRVANGMDPNFEGWGDQKVLNLGCSGGFMFETTGISRYLLEQEMPEVILFGVDPGDLSSPFDTRPLGDYYGSPFAPGGDRVDREMRYLIGISTLEISIETLSRKHRGKLASYTPEGLRVRSDKAGQRSQIDFIRSRLLGEAFLAEDGRKQRPINQDKAKELESILRMARTAGTRVILYIHPQHAVMHARAADKSDPPVFFRRERPTLVEMVDRVNAEGLAGPPVELWDFFDFHPINCEPLPIDGRERMDFWGDLGHYSLPVGNTMQARMMGWDVPLEIGEDYGTRLSSENLEERLEEVRAGYEAYLNGPGARDVEWKEELFRKAE